MQLQGGAQRSWANAKLRVKIGSFSPYDIYYFFSNHQKIFNFFSPTIKKFWHFCQSSVFNPRIKSVSKQWAYFCTVRELMAFAPENSTKMSTFFDGWRKKYFLTDFKKKRGYKFGTYIFFFNICLFQHNLPNVLSDFYHSFFIRFRKVLRWSHVNKKNTYPHHFTVKTPIFKKYSFWIGLKCYKTWWKKN